MNETTRRRSAGYNLVEVLIATAIMGVVSLSIFTLFFMGRSNVYSGKQMTQAVAIGTRVMEDISAYNQQNLYATAFAIAAAGAIDTTAGRMRRPPGISIRAICSPQRTTPCSAASSGYR